MARPRTATKILEMRGAFKKHPERKRPREPKPSAALNKRTPSHLKADQQKSWRLLMKLVPPGVLMNSDLLIVEIAACLTAEYRRDPDAMPTARITRLETVIGKLGLTPPDRAKLMVAETEVPGDFDDV